VVPPLQYGDSKVLNAWVHDPKESVDVIFNQAWWPGVAEDDMISVTGGGVEEDKPSYFLFIVTKDDGRGKLHQLQVRLRFRYGALCDLSDALICHHPAAVDS
jgi:hypothetical protein